MRFAMILFLCVAPASAAEGDLELANAAATACEANRVRFTAWTIEFNYTVAYAKTLDDALARRWTDEAVARGYSTYDGTRGRFEVVNNLKDLAEKRVKVGRGRYQTHLRSGRYLTDGKVTLYDRFLVGDDGAEIRHRVQIQPGTELFRQNLNLPLAIGNAPLAAKGLPGQVRLVEAQDSGRKLAVRENVDLRGVPVVEFTFTGPDKKAIKQTYWVDLEHAAIPRQTLSEIPAPKGVNRDFRILDDLRDAGDGRWFPYRRLDFYEAQGIVQERVITHADFTPPRDPSAYQLTFDKPVRVTDGARGGSYPPHATWNLEALPASEFKPWQIAGSQGRAGSSASGGLAPFVPPPTMPGERPATSAIWYVAAIVVGVVLVAGAILLYRRSGRNV